MARHLDLTFAATVGHLTSAIRKLATAATAAEATVDMAFMSTSRWKATPVRYMGAGRNVLWELQPREESDGGFHCGADIALLSQFEKEQEVLSPPCCLLAVIRASVASLPSVVTWHPMSLSSARARREVDGGGSRRQVEEDSRKFVAVQVHPSFV